MRREDREPGILERDEAHEDVAVLALAADLLGVGLHRLVAVVAVGDQQLGLGGGALDGGDRAGVGHAPQRGARCRRRRSPRPRAPARWPGRARSTPRRRGRRRARRSARCSRAWRASGAGGPPWGPGGCARAGARGPRRRARCARGRRSRGGCALVRRGPCSPACAPTARAARRARARPSRCHASNSSPAEA